MHQNWITNIVISKSKTSLCMLPEYTITYSTTDNFTTVPSTKSEAITAPSARGESTAAPSVTGKFSTLSYSFYFTY